MIITKPGMYVTRGGLAAEIVSIKGDFALGWIDGVACFWRVDGRCFGKGCGGDVAQFGNTDILSEYREPVTREVWVVIYDFCGTRTIQPTAFFSEAFAKTYCSSGDRDNRHRIVAIKKITIADGEGIEA